MRTANGDGFVVTCNGALIIVDDSVALNTVAGTIAASGKNNNGVLGFVDDEACCLYIARLFPEQGGATMLQLVESIKWTVDQGVKIINMSLGSPSGYKSVKEAIQYGVDRGVLFVAASG